MKSLLFAALAFTSSLTAQTVAGKLETLLLLPEPAVLRNNFSFSPEGAEKTVLTPAKELTDVPGIMAYSSEEFKQLGLSVATFTERAKKAADIRLASLKPHLVKDDAGKVLYAVYRSEKPLIASLLVAPSLPLIFESLFGSEVWVAIPDRHSLFIFPAKPEALEEFTADLADRFHNDPRAASSEIFSLKKDTPIRVVGSFMP
ncbi:hypothetical protein EI77_03868 [Prosthecobacter fusiformis]|uniref:DUF1444 family protein n=1 Tax=Prosthecobacter fusiformis TaxID=48464 RepID=A0A4R7RLB3_9BACT|nr:hypothetical protein [Prosthecobacter fusiformis]TDU66131.1 hypothetical protein EI77_03868 [Prosthecobacter fusiformis]